jgi:hypothetical protein
MKIEQYEARAAPLDHLKQFRPRVGLADDLEVVVWFEGPPNTSDQQRVVIGDEQRDRTRTAATHVPRLRGLSWIRHVFFPVNTGGNSLEC